MRIILLAYFSLLCFASLKAQNHAGGIDALYGGGKDTNFFYQDYQKLIDNWVKVYNTGDTITLKTFYSPDAEYISHM